MAGKVSKKGSKKNGNVVEQLQKFYDESTKFINKCEKPNKKGNISFLTFRILENHTSMCDWISRYGIYWVLCQADFHPNQQHHLRNK